MVKVISIHDAKTSFSKLVKKAQAGETIYVGAYGNAQAVIAPLPTKKDIPIGVWADKRRNAKVEHDLTKPDNDISQDFNKSLEKPLY